MTINAGADAASDVPRERAAVRCPECGTAENAGDFARIPWVVRRLPGLAVIAVGVVMAAYALSPRLSSPLGDWLPAWESRTWFAQDEQMSSFVGHGYRVSEVRGLLASETPSPRPAGDLVRAILDATRGHGEEDLDAQIIVGAKQPHAMRREDRMRGWPIVWSVNSSSLRYTDALKGSGLLSDPEFPLQQPHTSSGRTLAAVTTVWTQTESIEYLFGFWKRTIYPPALLAPVVVSVAVFELVRLFTAWRSRGGVRRGVKAWGRTLPARAAAWASIGVFAVFALAAMVVRDVRTEFHPLPALAGGSPINAALGLTWDELDGLGTTRDADRRVAARILSALDGSEVRDDDALIVDTSSNQIVRLRILRVGGDSSVAGESLLTISTRRMLDANDSPSRSRVGLLRVHLRDNPARVELTGRLPLDRTTSVIVGVGVHALLFWFAVGGAGMYAARGVRRTYRGMVTRGRRRRGECLRCRYDLREA